MGPHDSEEFKLALMIADIHQEVHGLVKSCDSHKMLSKLAIQIKPAKGIIAKAAFPKGKLVLVPYSMKVITRKTKPEPLPNAVRVVCPAWKEREFWLANPNQWPKESSEDSGFISPVFCMQNTDEEDLANMEVFLSGNKASKVRIPLYRNTKKIAIDDHLQISKVKNVAGQIAAEEPPAKRPRSEEPERQLCSCALLKALQVFDESRSSLSCACRGPSQTDAHACVHGSC